MYNLFFMCCYTWEPGGEREREKRHLKRTNFCNPWFCGFLISGSLIWLWSIPAQLWTQVTREGSYFIQAQWAALKDCAAGLREEKEQSCLPRVIMQAWFTAKHKQENQTKGIITIVNSATDNIVLRLTFVQENSWYLIFSCQRVTPIEIGSFQLDFYSFLQLHGLCSLHCLFRY